MDPALVIEQRKGMGPALMVLRSGPVSVCWSGVSWVAKGWGGQRTVMCRSFRYHMLGERMGRQATFVGVRVQGGAVAHLVEGHAVLWKVVGSIPGAYSFLSVSGLCSFPFSRTPRADLTHKKKCSPQNYKRGRGGPGWVRSWVGRSHPKRPLPLFITLPDGVVLAPGSDGAGWPSHPLYCRCLPCARSPIPSILAPCSRSSGSLSCLAVPLLLVCCARPCPSWCGSRVLCVCVAPPRGDVRVWQCLSAAMRGGYAYKTGYSVPQRLARGRGACRDGAVQNGTGHLPAALHSGVGTLMEQRRKQRTHAERAADPLPPPHRVLCQRCMSHMVCRGGLRQAGVPPPPRAMTGGAMYQPCR